jgi:enoyl-CoA hydratase/carnithine racemase
MNEETALSNAGPKARLDRHDLVTELVIDSPPLNLFDQAMTGDLERAVDGIIDLVDRGETRAVLVRAEGKVFCAGVDVHEFQDLSRAEGARLMARFLSLVKRLEEVPVPTLAVVHALNLTIGWELSLGCDLLWAAEGASFGLVEATVGLTPGGGGTQRLVARAGAARAAEVVLTGDIYPAEQMYGWGVVNRVLPPDRLLPEARELAARLAAGPTAAAAVGKRIVATARDHGVAAADAITASAVGDVFATEDLPTGITSLLEQGPRKATFSGR